MLTQSPVFCIISSSSSDRVSTEMIIIIHIQLNLVNLKSSELEVSFLIISSSNYTEDQSRHKYIYIPYSKVIIISFFLSNIIKHKFWVRKRNVSMRRFFYPFITYVIIDSY